MSDVHILARTRHMQLSTDTNKIPHIQPIKKLPYTERMHNYMLLSCIFQKNTDEEWA
jgi:hypothetical protein